MKWLFIVGINNGGTSLINHLLSFHQKIDHLILEGHAAKNMVGPWNYKTDDGLNLSRIWSENPEPLRNPQVDVKKVYDEWLSMRVTTDGWYTMEKSPPNSLRTPWLQENFPIAYFLVITRDPVAVCEGIHRKRPVVSLERAAHHWNKTMDILTGDLSKLNRKHIISYEELCSHPKKTLDNIIENWLELPPHNYGEVLGEVIDLGYKRMRKSKIKNWNKWSYEQLTQKEIESIQNITRKMRKRFNY